MSQSVMAGVLREQPSAILFLIALTPKTAATGILAAHLYEFLTRIYPSYGGGRNPITTPAFVHRIFETDRRTTSYRDYGEVSQPATRGTTSGSSGSVLPPSWKNRGSGRVLGG